MEWRMDSPDRAECTMDSEILIDVTRDEIRVGLLDGGQVVEFYVERKRDASLVGNIYKGKVVKILPGMQSAFVDIGLEKAAFLYVTDIHAGLEEFAPFLDEEEKVNSIELVSKKRKTGPHDRGTDTGRTGNPRSGIERPVSEAKGHGSPPMSPSPAGILCSCRMSNISAYRGESPTNQNGHG